MKDTINSNLFVDREVRNAVKKAVHATGKFQRVIIQEALEDWLIQYGYLDEDWNKEDAPVVQR